MHLCIDNPETITYIVGGFQPHFCKIFVKLDQIGSFPPKFGVKIKNIWNYHMGVSLNGGTPISHPKCWSFLVGKTMVVGETHHFKKPLHRYDVVWLENTSEDQTLEPHSKAWSMPSPLVFPTTKLGICSAGFFHDVNQLIHLSLIQKSLGRRLVEVEWLVFFFVFFLGKNHS